MVMSDHPTPVKIRTHTSDPVPFLLWGPGFKHNGGNRFNETEAKNSRLFIGQGSSIMGKFIGE
jgi:2,3-bisphosphoglycerate-independent phosphoglycerate mutase